MGLQARHLLFDASGRIRNTGTAPTQFNGGTPTNNAGLLCVVSATPSTRFHAGLGYSNGTPDALCIADAAPVGSDPWNGGVRVSANVRVYIDRVNSINAWVAGLPVTANGRLCLATAE